MHHRRSIRLKGYDYAQAGVYYVTLVTRHRVCLFGNIIDGEFNPNEAGIMVEKWWYELPHKFPRVETDDFIVMPNHFHGIILINDGSPVGVDLRVCPFPDSNDPAHRGAIVRGAHTGAPLPEIVQWFKTMTTNEYIRGVKHAGWPPFMGKLWQRNYYEHIIRNENDLERIQKYIQNNPISWEDDNENPIP